MLLDISNYNRLKNSHLLLTWGIMLSFLFCFNYANGQALKTDSVAYGFDSTQTFQGKDSSSVSKKNNKGKTVVSGKITDASTGEAIPFANVYFYPSLMGTVTDFDGFFTLSTSDKDEEVVVKYIGYEEKKKSIVVGATQTLMLQLNPAGFELKEIVIRPGENPAYRKLRGVWANKEKNDKRSLKAYQYEAYSKIELDANNLTKKFTNSVLMRPFKKIFDSLQLIAGEDGKPILPVFISEILSEYYLTKNPDRKTEIIKANRTMGIGVEDGEFISQMMGATFLDYNFYDNYLNILEKNFVSPISRDGIAFYKYYLNDSLVIDGKYCFRIDFVPRRPLDLAFSGSIWITDTTFALKRIVAEIGKEANLNFIQRIKIQQELAPTVAGPWLPTKLRILVDVRELTKNTVGFLAKMYGSYQNFTVNEPKPNKFYEEKLKVDPTSHLKKDTFWDNHRHEKLTQDDKIVYKIIDSVKHIPKVKSYVEIIDFLVNGYGKAGKYLEVGPYIYLYGTNIIEGNRFRFGFRTNYAFSDRWIFKGYGAYGTFDNQFKYSFQAEHFLSRNHWWKVGIQYKKDLEGLGVQDEFFSDNTLLNASSQLGLINRMNRVELWRAWTEGDIMQGLNGRVYFMTKNFVPVQVNDYNFTFYPDPIKKPYEELRSFTTNELTLSLRYCKKDHYVALGNKRALVLNERSPVITPTYTYGFESKLLGGQFNFHKISLNLQEQFKLGWFGRSSVSITGNILHSKDFLPYPLMDIQLGNETAVRSDDAFNLMKFFEFIGSKSVTGFVTHNFDGLIFNKVPLLNRLKWREVVGVKAAVVGLSPKQKEYYSNLPEKDVYGNLNQKLSFADPTIPYVEVFYGIDNIFKILRIDAIHRLTYRDRALDNRSLQNFFIKGSLSFSF